MNLVIVICPGQSLETIRGKFATSRIQLLPVILGQLRPEAVDGDDERPPVGLEPKYLAHYIRRLSSNVLTEAVE